ncbi:hypothetical protein BGZ54_010090 [Gamsiella multidivaricata]|nr:hypothetical protein BGZ54_010090 [Gamsiella multidivaricata]
MEEGSIVLMEKDNRPARLEAKAEAQEKETDTLRYDQAPQSLLQEDHGRVLVYVAINGQELTLELHRAMARVRYLEGVMLMLEEEIIQVKVVQDTMFDRDRTLPQIIQAMHRETVWQENEASRLKMALGCSSKTCQEEECKELQRQVVVLERIKEEQQEQLESRERVLKRKDEARKTYDKTYKNRIEAFEAEQAAVERRVFSEYSAISSH